MQQVIAQLDAGKLRVAEKTGGEWITHQWVKKAVLLSFRLEDNQVVRDGYTNYFDKVPAKFADYGAADFKAGGFRVVPPAAVRRGAFIAQQRRADAVLTSTSAPTWMKARWSIPGRRSARARRSARTCTCPAAWASAACWSRCRPIPTIIEDNCFIGARSEIVEGVIVGEGSVISMGVYIGQSTKIYHRETGEITLRPHSCRLGRGFGQSAVARTANTASIAPSSSSRWTPRPAPRPASTSCCAIDAARAQARRKRCKGATVAARSQTVADGVCSAARVGDDAIAGA